MENPVSVYFLRHVITFTFAASTVTAGNDVKTLHTPASRSINEGEARSRLSSQAFHQPSIEINITVALNHSV